MEPSIDEENVELKKINPLKTFGSKEASLKHSFFFL